MGDVVSLVERMQEGVKEEEAARMAQRMLENKFDYNDFLNQMRLLSRLGGLTGFMKMLPGAWVCPCMRACVRFNMHDSIMISSLASEQAGVSFIIPGALHEPVLPPRSCPWLVSTAAPRC